MLSGKHSVSRIAEALGLLPPLQKASAFGDLADPPGSASKSSALTGPQCRPFYAAPAMHAASHWAFLDSYAQLRAKGIDAVAVTAVNDVFTLDAWLKNRGAYGKIDALADGSGFFTRALGMEFDLYEFGLGVRGKRFSAVVEDNIIRCLNVEENSSLVTVSSAEELLKHL